MRTYSTREAAKLIGVAKITLEKWIRTGAFRPSVAVPLDAHRNLWRWTDADVKRARKLKAERKPGPKPRRR